jgi:hypothetical protein
MKSGYGFVVFHGMGFLGYHPKFNDALSPSLFYRLGGIRLE